MITELQIDYASFIIQCCWFSLYDAFCYKINPSSMEKANSVLFFNAPNLSDEACGPRCLQSFSAWSDSRPTVVNSSSSCIYCGIVYRIGSSMLCQQALAASATTFCLITSCIIHTVSNIFIQSEKSLLG